MRWRGSGFKVADDNSSAGGNASIETLVNETPRIIVRSFKHKQTKPCACWDWSVTGEASVALYDGERGLRSRLFRISRPQQNTTVFAQGWPPCNQRMLP